MNSITLASSNNAKLSANTEICRYYLSQPILACMELLREREAWVGTRADFIVHAKKLTGGLGQAHVYRVLSRQRFIPDFGMLPGDQQPTWVQLNQLSRIKDKDKRFDAWMTAVWSNSGTSRDMPRYLLRDSIKLVLAQPEKVGET